MAVTRLVLVVLAVTDLPRAKEFYRSALGWSATVDVPVFVQLQGDGISLGLYERRSFGVNTGAVPHAIPRGELAPCELYLHVDDLDAAEARLRDAGARLLSARARRDWGDEATYFADPDGNVVVVARPL